MCQGGQRNPFGSIVITIVAIPLESTSRGDQCLLMLDKGIKTCDKICRLVEMRPHFR